MAALQSIVEAMNPGLARIIADYQRAVRQAVALLEQSAITRPASNHEWAFLDIPHRGTLKEGVRYFKHGYGCAVHLSEGTVDFDFGAKGEIDGFDVWRLAGFAEARLPDYGFADEDALKACFNQEVEAGSLHYSGYILYYVAPLEPHCGQR